MFPPGAEGGGAPPEGREGGRESEVGRGYKDLSPIALEPPQTGSHARRRAPLPAAQGPSPLSGGTHPLGIEMQRHVPCISETSAAGRPHEYEEAFEEGRRALDQIPI